MRRALALVALLGLIACEGEPDESSPFEYRMYPADQASPAPAAPAPAEPAPADAPPADTPADDGPPPMERAIEPRSDGNLRVLALYGGGYHEFTGNLSRLLPALAARAPMTLTELTIDPSEPASGTSLRVLAEADLAAEFDVLLVYTQGDLPLTDAVKEKLLAFVRGGGGLVGLHCAADSFPGWAGWDDLLRGRFESHPPFGDIVVAVADTAHPVVAGLPPEWILKDEFYHLQNCDWNDKRVIMAGTSPEGGEPRPVTWVREVDKGRVVYTILGHGPEVHGDERYQQLVVQALQWAAGR